VHFSLDNSQTNQSIHKLTSQQKARTKCEIMSLLPATAYSKNDFKPCEIYTKSFENQIKS